MKFAPMLLVAMALVAGALLAASAGASPASVAATAVKCSSSGTTWRLAYNKKAVKTGNPIRIVHACCQDTRKRGVMHCFLEVGLAGSPSRGCESVDIGPAGLPVSIGKHEDCIHRP